MSRGWLMCGVGLLLAGCGGAASEPKSEPPKPDEVEALLERTLESLVFVEGGTFMMGDVGRRVIAPWGEEVHRDWTGDRDTHPAHEVTLDSYSIQKYEITYEEYDLFTQETGRELLKEIYIGDLKTRDPEYPAWGMGWHDARAYCRWLGELSGLPFDLPTEAQWEFAARSRGKNVPYATDDGTLDFGRNYRGPDAPRGAEPPGTYPPNPLGLYDMTGNAMEWVLDWYGPYTAEPKHNPTGPETGRRKVQRGGSDLGFQDLNLLFRRSSVPPDNPDAGLRCVVNATEPVR